MPDHRRDSEMEEYRHQREDDNIPSWLKWTFIAINRVGFPIVAFFCILYMVIYSQKRLSESLERQSLSLEALILTVNANHSEGKLWRDQILEDMRDLKRRLN